jgi:hypothetical protein
MDPSHGRARIDTDEERHGERKTRRGGETLAAPPRPSVEQRDFTQKPIPAARL